MALDPQLVIWLFFSLVAVVILTRMMDERRVKLGRILQAYVQERVQWAKKRAKATRLAQQLAQKRAIEEADKAIAMQASAAVGGTMPPPSATSVESRDASVSVGSST